MSMIASRRKIERLVDAQTPPASIDEPVRPSRIPPAACDHCGDFSVVRLIGRTCMVCGAGTVKFIPPEDWAWCRACGGKGPCCNPCNWKGIVLRGMP